MPAASAADHGHINIGSAESQPSLSAGLTHCCLLCDADARLAHFLSKSDSASARNRCVITTSRTFDTFRFVFVVGVLLFLTDIEAFAFYVVCT